MTAREADLAARYRLDHLDQIPVYIRDRRWCEIAAVVRYAAQDAPLSLIGTDNALYRHIRSQITEFRIAGWHRLNVERLEMLANGHDELGSSLWTER